LRLFSSSLIKIVVYWFFTLWPKSINNWKQIKKAYFHEHIYRTKREVTLVNLFKIVQDPRKSIKIYAFHLRTLKIKYATSVTKYECIKLIIEKMKWNLRKWFIETKYSNVTQYKKMMIKWAKNKPIKEMY
jgi:hypothetical protein